MRVLVTGGAGFIGSHTADALLERGHDVRILDNLQKPVHLKGMPPWIPADAEFVEADVRDRSAWERCLDGVGAVFHLAAYQDYLPDFSTFFHTNAVGTALLYEVAVERNLDLSRVVVASSQFVAGEGLYECPACRVPHAPLMRDEVRLAAGKWEHACPDCGGELSWMWTPEEHASPPNAYAMAKHSQQSQALTFGRRYGIPSVALRYSIVQGPRQSFYNAYSGACRIFCLHYYFDKAPTLYEDGGQLRDFVNIHDVVRANMMALEDPRMVYNAWNVGGGRPYSVAEFARIVRREVASRKGTDLPEAEIPGLYRFGDSRNALSDISRMRALGWEPVNTPEDSVREYVDWLYEQDNVEDILEYANKAMRNLNVVRKAGPAGA
ncbi:MAG: NAD-dependent epimerase/dehydratase family protein [Desulfatibacillaceae bacterium]